MFIFLSFIVRIIVSPSMTLLFVGSMYSFFWLPQIVRSARRSRSSGLTKEYLVGTTICRLFFALCEFIHRQCTMIHTHLFLNQTSWRARKTFLMWNLGVSRHMFSNFGYLALTSLSSAWIYFLAVFMFLQVLVIILQEHLGPAFFLPKRVPFSLFHL